MWRLFTWLVWTVLFALIPFGFLGVVGWLPEGEFPGPSELLGSGELMLVAVALLGIGFSELIGLEELRIDRHRWIVMSAAAFAFVIASLFYGAVAAQRVFESEPWDPDRVTLLSLCVYVVSILLSGWAMILSDPKRVRAAMAKVSTQ
jgi:hypothetical protein